MRSEEGGGNAGETVKTPDRPVKHGERVAGRGWRSAARALTRPSLTREFQPENFPLPCQGSDSFLLQNKMLKKHEQTFP